MRFLKRLNRTLHDIENENSLLIHGLVGCNLNCYGCINKKELIDDRNILEYMTEDELIDAIKDNSYFFDNIIFSGGEITLCHKDLKNVILKIKDFFDGNIIIYTNGTNIEGLKYLNDVVDGFHMDLKFDLNTGDRYRVCGADVDPSLILECLDFIYENNKGFSVVRTVKYPMYSFEYLKNMERFMKKKYPDIKYSQNDFVYP